MNYWEIFINGYKGYAGYLWYEITHPGWHNYFYWLILLSVFFFLMEWRAPWRAKQPKFRKDFWLDVFYMFFNFFLFSLIIYNAASDVVVHFFNDLIGSATGFELQAANPMRHWSAWAILLTGFVVRDFIQWWIHRLLHRSAFLWEFHKVHHSVEQMGFAAHLRYHWMENIVYRSLEYIPLALLGIGLYDFFVIHIFSLAIGHYNHSNITVPSWVTGGVLGGLIGILVATNAFDIQLSSWLFEEAGVLQHIVLVVSSILIGSLLFRPLMRYLFNSPEMHIWHHAKDLPEGRRFGVNFGLSLAIWDYLWGTAYIPHNGRDIKLGFPGVEQFPQTFLEQNIHGLGINKRMAKNEQ